MRERRKARMVALEMLYQREMTDYSLETIIQNRLQADEKELPEFALHLAEGVSDNKNKIDDMIKGYADNWSIDRMPCVDRNIIRIGIYEMIYESDIPISVSINEAVEVAKAYGSEESGKFVNGILGKVAHVLEEKNSDGNAERTD